MLSPYKDFIIETVQHNLPRESKIVNVDSIKDIGKTSEILAKPILLIRKPKPTLIVIDQNVIYTYEINLER